MLGDRGQQLPGAGVFEEQGAGTGPHREDHQSAEAEGEAERGTAGEDVVRVGAQHVPGEGVGYGQHVPVEVHAALRAAGGAGGERDQGDVVRGGVDRGERGAGRRTAQQVVGAVTAVRRDAQPGCLGLRQVVHGPDVAQRVPDLGDLAHRGQLVRALLGQHRDRDRARLQHGQPACGEPGGGGAAQQDPVARYDAQVTGEDMGDAVDAGAQLAVGPGGAVRGVEDGAGGVGVAEEFGGAVEPFGVVQLRQVEAQPGPLVRRRQMVAREGVDVGRDMHGGSFAPLP